MTVQDVLSQITVENGIVTSKSTGKRYQLNVFIDEIAAKLKWTKREKAELERHFIEYIKPQTDASKYVESIITKYNIKFSDGVYILGGRVMSMDMIYRLMWKNERLLPTDVDNIIENIEKISEPLELQGQIFEHIKSRSKFGVSRYLASLDYLYPNIKWREVLYNILVPKTRPLFHIFYDDGVGGTGKSTLLEVLTKIVGEGFVSNVLLDQFGNRFIFSNMLGKYLNIGDDNGKNDELQNVGTLKSIITGNRVTIDRKNINPIEVRIFAKQLFATNILPYIDFTDGGIMRRLNIVPMNHVIPKTMELPEFDEDEIGAIIYEVLNAKDLKDNQNELAITSSPLFRFYKTEESPTYEKYRFFCQDNGFRCMNVINFEVKSKFIKSYLKGEKSEQTKLVEVSGDDLPF